MLSESTLSFAGVAACWTAVIAGTWKLFDNADKAASAETKARFANWIRGADPGKPITRLSNAFANAFDSVFGARLLATETFGKSCIASIACILVAFVIWIWLRPDQAAEFLSSGKVLEQLFGMGLLAAMLSLVPDYISLVKTRCFITYLRASGVTLGKIIVLIADAMISAAIGLASFAGISHYILGAEWAYSWEVLKQSILPLRAWKPGQLPLGMFFYATFFTSVWMWLYCLSSVVLRATHPIARGRDFVARFLDIEGRPFLAIGVVATVLETALFATVAIFVVVARSV